MANPVGASTVFLIPTEGGGGAEKIFEILRTYSLAIGQDVTFALLWRGRSCSLIQRKIPHRVILRLVSLPLAAYRLAKMFPNGELRVVAFLPLALGVAALVSMIRRSKTHIVYCRRNKYPAKSMNWRLEKIFVRFARHIVFCSEDVVFPLLKGQTSVTQNNPIPRLANGWCSFGKEIQICVVGRLCPQKRPDLAVDSYALFRHSDGAEAVRLDFLGVGEMEERVSERVRALAIENWVQFHGFVADPFSSPSYRVLLHTSLYEGSPNTIFEAISHGLIVVCKSNLPGLSHLSEHIREACFVFVREEGGGREGAWARAIGVAVDRARKVKRDDLVEIVSASTETDWQFAERFMKALRAE